MDIFDIILNPYFFIGLFLTLGLVAILGPIFVKSKEGRKRLVWAIVAGVLIFFIPYAYAFLMWLLVNVFHVIQ